MSTEQKGPEFILDQAITDIRNEEVPPAVVEKAAERVWARISEQQPAEAIRGCADFRALIPAYLDGRLPEGRALLLKDHAHECPACRKALAAARRPASVVQMPARTAWHVWRAGRNWAIAATVLAALGLSGYLAVDRFWPAPAGSRAVVQSLDGAMYKVAAETSAPVSAGAAIADREVIRTAKGSGTLIRLRDGSLVEVRERTELSLSERRDGTTIRLQGGSIIVQAAKRRSGHLYVATDDCLVSVTGTVFSVNRGMKGSRVSVIEGEVQVAQGGQARVLRPGEQYSTNPSLGPVPLDDEIAWSRNVDAHIALLREFSALRKKLEAIPGAGLRYSTRLLDLVPEGTVFYASIPNLGSTLTEAKRLFDEQLAQSEVLRQWWAEKMKSAGGQADIDEILRQIRSFSDYLGPEIVLVTGPERAGQHQSPLLLAEVTRSGFRAFLENEINKLNAGRGIRIMDDPARQAAPAGTLLMYLRGDIVAVSTDPALLRAMGAGAFSQSAFYARIAEAYRDGAGWLFCADLQSMAAPAKPAGAQASMGLSDIRYLIVERKEVAGRTENRAALTFAGARHGVASWLAAPAPMRTLDFITPEATFVTALVVQNPAVAFDELAGMLGASSLAEFEAQTGLNLRADLAGPLGGELAFAMDGPVLPQPSWKLVVEVYDPARLQMTVEKLVENINREGRKSGAPPVRLDKEQAGGRTFYALRGMTPGSEAHYVFQDGYLIAAPSRALLLRAIQSRETGYNLPRSAKFTALLPRDGQANYSGLVYHDLGAAMKTLGGALPLSPEQRKSLESVTPGKEPTLVLAYGEQDRIQLASTGSLFGLNLESVLAGQAHGPSRARRK